MAKKTSKDFRIKELYYYIVDFKQFMKPELLPVYFVNKNAAKRVLEANVPNRNRRKLYSIIKGLNIKNEHIPYKLGHGNFFHCGSKYAYPDRVRTKQDRKSYRTLLRRRLRRMGLQTTVKQKHTIHEEKVKKVKVLENKQDVAKSPGTAAKAFYLDRKPKYWVYLILKKCPSSKRGKLFKIKAIRINLKSGEFKKVTIHTMRNDIFIPELIYNIENLPNGKAGVTAYYSHKGEPKKVLRKHMA
jgi:hypothetical protein